MKTISKLIILNIISESVCLMIKKSNQKKELKKRYGDLYLDAEEIIKNYEANKSKS